MALTIGPDDPTDWSYLLGLGGSTRTDSEYSSRIRAEPATRGLIA